MISTVIRGAVVAAAAATLIGGIAAGSAQAQSMPRHAGQTSQAQPVSGPDWGVAAPPGKPWPVTAARGVDVRAQPNGVPGNIPTCNVITGDGVNIRRSAWGTVIGTANHRDAISEIITTTWDGAGEPWYEIVDYTQGNKLGFVIGRYVSIHNTPWYACPYGAATSPSN